MYRRGFPKVFDGSDRKNIPLAMNGGNPYNRQVQVYAANADGSGYELNCEEVRVSPIGLDLDKSGDVERIDGIFHFDIDGNGEKKYMNEWFAPTEGILIDATIPGAISGVHLFGDQGGNFTDGYDKLSTKRDANKDGVISGEELKGLQVWRDINSDAELDRETELFDLNDDALGINITSLETLHTDYLSSAALASGGAMMTEDLWFEEHEEGSGR